MNLFKTICVYGFIIGGIVMLASLSLWQIERLAWKENLIAEIETGLSNSPQSIQTKQDLKTLSLYNKVTATGEFLYDYEHYLQPRVRQSKRGDKQQGIEHLVPFLLEDRQTILFINRGWFPKSVTADASVLNKIPRPGGQQTITAIIHPEPTGNIFTPENDLRNDFIYWADINGLIEHHDMTKRASSFLFKEIYSTDTDNIVYLPQKFDAEITLPNNHEKYAYFWGVMAIIWAGFGVMFITNRKRA